MFGHGGGPRRKKILNGVSNTDVVCVGNSSNILWSVRKEYGIEKDGVSGTVSVFVDSIKSSVGMELTICDQSRVLDKLLEFARKMLGHIV